MEVHMPSGIGAIIALLVLVIVIVLLVLGEIPVLIGGLIGALALARLL